MFWLSVLDFLARLLFCVVLVTTTFWVLLRADSQSAAKQDAVTYRPSANLVALEEKERLRLEREREREKELSAVPVRSGLHCFGRPWVPLKRWPITRTEVKGPRYGRPFHSLSPRGPVRPITRVDDTPPPPPPPEPSPPEPYDLEGYKARMDYLTGLFGQERPQKRRPARLSRRLRLAHSCSRHSRVQSLSSGSLRRAWSCKRRRRRPVRRRRLRHRQLGRLSRHLCPACSSTRRRQRLQWAKRGQRKRGGLRRLSRSTGRSWRRRGLRRRSSRRRRKRLPWSPRSLHLTWSLSGRQCGPPARPPSHPRRGNDWLTASWMALSGHGGCGLAWGCCTRRSRVCGRVNIGFRVDSTLGPRKIQRWVHCRLDVGSEKDSMLGPRKAQCCTSETRRHGPDGKCHR